MSYSFPVVLYLARGIVKLQYAITESDDYRRRLDTGDGTRPLTDRPTAASSHPQHRRWLFDDGEPVEIQQLRRVRFDDDMMLSATTKHRRSLTADLSATKYDIGTYVGAYPPRTLCAAEVMDDESTATLVPCICC